MRASSFSALLACALVLAACGPKAPPPNPTPPVTKASLQAEGMQAVKRGLALIDEMEALRDSDQAISRELGPQAKGKKGKSRGRTGAPPAPKPAGMNAEQRQELGRLLEQAGELRDQMVVLREDLDDILDRAAEPLSEGSIAKARASITRMTEKLTDLRDLRNRAIELKPRPPEPAKKDKPAPSPPAPAAKKA